VAWSGLAMQGLAMWGEARQGMAWFYDYKRFDGMNKQNHFIMLQGKVRLGSVRRGEVRYGMVGLGSVG